jgi:hypothetical protein
LCGEFLGRDRSLGHGLEATLLFCSLREGEIYPAAERRSAARRDRFVRGTNQITIDRDGETLFLAPHTAIVIAVREKENLCLFTMGGSASGSGRFSRASAL